MVQAPLDLVKRWSLPLPGAWIEIACVLFCLIVVQSRSLYRERGLKFRRSSSENMQRSRSLYRERGLKSLSFEIYKSDYCRSLYRERGLKFTAPAEPQISGSSLPLPGAWIEMLLILHALCIAVRRSLYRERGLKYGRILKAGVLDRRRSLYRERGLK